MNKTYISPKTTVLTLEAEQMLAISSKFSDDSGIQVGPTTGGGSGSSDPIEVDAGDGASRALDANSPIWGSES